MNLKKGTQVKIISGKDKGKSGEILEINRKLNKIKIKSINMVKRHTKPTKENKGGKWNFNLIAGNNKVIATSQSYADKSSMNKGIKSVMTNAPKMKIS